MDCNESLDVFPVYMQIPMLQMAKCKYLSLELDFTHSLLGHLGEKIKES